MKILNWLTFLALAAIAGFYMYTHQPQVRGIVQMVESQIIPCRRPLTYSIGSIDSRFDISRKILIADLLEAEDIWEKASNRDLYEYRESGGAVTVDLAYDSRQVTSNTLSRLDSMNDANKAEYNSIKAQYTAMKQRVSSEQAHYEELVAQYNARPSDAGYREAKAYEATLNANIAELNALARELNQVAAKYNMNVDQYNETSASAGEFEEGLYSYKNGVQTITIYEYSDHNELVRVLAHELGHALGLDHVSDSSSIMYAVNKGGTLQASAADMAELKAICSKGL